MEPGEPERATRVRNICELLLQGGFDTLAEFLDAWPRDTEGIALYGQIYADCETAAEHTPAHIVSRRLNWKAWRQSGLPGLLSLDVEVLDQVAQGLSYTEAQVLRDHMLADQS